MLVNASGQSSRDRPVPRDQPRTTCESESPPNDSSRCGKPRAPLPRPARHGLAALVALVAALVIAPPPAAAALTDAQLAGQHVIFGYVGTAPPRALKERIRRG